MKKTKSVTILALILLLNTVIFAQTNMQDELKNISTPAKLSTRAGALHFDDGRPEEKSTQIIYENIDYIRGVDVFLNTMPGASLFAMRRGQRAIGAADNTFTIFEELLDSKTLTLTGNTESVYASGFLNLKDGPLVLEYPPNVLGVLDDMWFRYIADFGNAGPDKGKGGKFLILPPDYKGKTPKGYYVAHSQTYGVWAVVRGFAANNDTAPTVKAIKDKVKIYPLSMAKNPPATSFINQSGVAVNTVHPNTFLFYEDINTLVQEEPAGALGPEITGQLASIGIIKGAPFNPSDSMKKTLADAAATASATARTLFFKPRDPQAYIYKDSTTWYVPFIGGSYEFLQNGARLLDARSMFFYGATVVTPAMTVEIPGAGSQYALASLDSKGKWLDGAKTYKLHLPANVPAKNFWSVTVYDPQTRSLLQTANPKPSVSSQTGKVKPNPDGSYDLYFGPKAPEGHEGNWVQTLPSKGWFAILRLYGPLPAWFDQTWRPGEFEEVK